METLIALVQQYAEWLYAICGFTALYNIYLTWQIRAARRQAVFTLERQKATDDLYRILFTAFILLSVMGATYFSSTVLARTVGLPAGNRAILENFRQTDGLPDAVASADNESDNGTDGASADSDGSRIDDSDSDDSGIDASSDSATADSAAAEDATNDTEQGDNGTGNDGSGRGQVDGAQTDQTDAADAGTTETKASPNSSANDGSSNVTAPSVVNAGTLPTPTQPIPTPTFTYAPPPTIAPAAPTAAPAVSQPPCPDPRTTITSPGNGTVVTGSFNIAGTVAHEQMQFYKIEYVSGTNTNQEFVYLSGGNDPISGGVLATIDSTIWYNGVWTIKVTVVDNTGNFPPPCTVTITVNN